MQIPFENDERIVMTLDAGGTSLKFSAIRANRLMFEPIRVSTDAHDLELCLHNILSGFEQVRELIPEPPVALSFAFPGPADYPRGVIGDLPNFPGFRGGVALGPMLRDRFGVPVHIHNDGDLFAYGEATAGFLPYVNQLLEEAGSPKRYHNLFGVTVGTGFGAGMARNGEMFLGDNSIACEAWLLRNKLDPAVNAEEGACIRAVRRAYAEAAGIALDDAPEPRQIFEIGMGNKPGDRAAACEAYRRLGEVAGDAIAQALTLIDGLAVIGGGIAGAHPLFLAALVDAVNASYPNGVQRLCARAYNFEDEGERQQFLESKLRFVNVPGSSREAPYDAHPRTAIGISRLGTSEAIAVGAYAAALNNTEKSKP
jgi:glucokinase